MPVVSTNFLQTVYDFFGVLKRKTELSEHRNKHATLHRVTFATSV